MTDRRETSDARTEVTAGTSPTVLLSEYESLQAQYEDRDRRLLATLADLAAARAEKERVWRYFETDAAVLRTERDAARAEVTSLGERLAAVGALCDEGKVDYIDAIDIRAALSGGS